MKTATTLAAALLLGLAPAQRIDYAPEKGESLTKRFTLTTSAELDDFTFSVDGQDMGGMLGDILFELESSQSYLVTDEVLAMGEGRPERLSRTFDELSGETTVSVEVQGEGDDTDSAMTSELEGASVVFSWDEDEGDFSAEFGEDDEGRDSDLLESLEEDMSLRAFMPDGDVEEGDSWEIPIENLFSVGMPGGNLSLVPEDTGDMDMEELEGMLEDLADTVEESFPDWTSGTVTATYTGDRDEDGTEVAVIEIEIDIDVDADLAELLTTVLEEVLANVDEAPEDLDFSFTTANLSMSIAGTGELTWDAAAGHIHAFSFQGDQDLELTVEADVDVEGQGTSFSVGFEASGSYGYTVEQE
jgi:hypothetical protein